MKLNRESQRKVIKSIKEDFIDFLNIIVCKKSYWLVLAIFIIMAYGLDLFNDSINMDDMAFAVFGRDDHYFVRIMRWGIYVIAPFINTYDYSPFINRFFALFFLALSSILLSFILYIISNKKEGVIRYTIASILFTTYPLINEIWEVSAMSVNIYYNGVSFYFFLVFIAIIYQYYSDGYDIKNIIFSGILLAPVAAGYESVFFAYITLVLVIIYYNNLNNKYDSKSEWFFDGLRYAIPLAIGLVLRIVIGKLLILIYGVEEDSTLSRTRWMSDGVVETLKNIVNNGWYYGVRALTYYPITVFVLALIAYIVIVIKDFKKSKLSLFLGICIVLSLFFLSFVQGDFLYYRQAQTVQLFVALVSFMILERINSKKAFNIVCALLVLIGLRQSVYLHELLALNHNRSENEEYIARQIGYKIYSEFDKDKTVIFAGEYQLGSFIEDQITINENSLGGKLENMIREKLNHDSNRLYDEFVYNNINSYFNKQMDAFYGQIMIKNYLAYFGYDINVLENLTDEEEDKLKGYYELIAKEENMKPYEIKDMGDYLLVYLGPTIDRVGELVYK